MRSQSLTGIVVKMDGDKVKFYNEHGSLVNTFRDNAISAEINSARTLLIVTLENGNVQLFNDHLSLINTSIADNASDAKFSGDNIIVTLRNGKRELRKANGAFISSY